ncbi:hypothetical protein DPMN_069645 [Dreissena polymorpha]|uniref:Uncharacterized protein n=1 Tax=Dreissena polymorpha TaxID=45954 RepID=A0A9D4BN92_DREPO|nr:hypothetical protein DPMN_069645 [Dreissena polymorpha]
MEEYLELLRDFEIKKRDVDLKSNTKVAITVPPSLFAVVQDVTKLSLQENLQASEFGETVCDCF